MNKKKGYFKTTVFIVQWMILFIGIILFSRTGFCETLFFEDVMAQVIARSYDLEIAEIEKEIGKHKRMESMAEYFPTLSVQLNDGYYRDLTEPDAVIIRTDITGYRNYLTFSADYNLFDFGAREMRYINASRNVKIAEHSITQQHIDTKIDALFIFKKGLILSKKLKARMAVLKYQSKIYELSKRLYKAGRLGKIDVAEAAIMVAEATQELDDLKVEWEKALQELSYYTGRSYDSDRTDFVDFSEPAPPRDLLNVFEMPEVKIYDMEIKKKEAEFYMITTEWFPKLSLYSSYQFYSYDASSFTDSFSDFQDEEYRIGLKVDLNLFNGFGDFARARQIRAELRKLKVEREKTIAEQRQLLNTLEDNARLYQEQSRKWEKYETRVSEKGLMDERLAKQKIRDQLYYLNKRIEETEKLLSVDLNQINRMATLYHLQFLDEKNSGPEVRDPGIEFREEQLIAEEDLRPVKKDTRINYNLK